MPIHCFQPLAQTEPDRYTWYHLPAAGSPAIDGGDASCLEANGEDQHGLARPAGAACDIGAIEVGATPVEPLVCGGVFTPTADATINSAQVGDALGGATTLQESAATAAMNSVLCFPSTWGSGCRPTMPSMPPHWN